MTQKYAKRGSKQAEDNAEEKRRKTTGTQTTRPITEGAMIRRWLEIAKDHDEHRKRGGPEWYLMLVLGFNTGLRISDLVSLKVGDIRGREDFVVLEGKTQKERQVHLKWSVRKKLDELLKDRKPEEYALQSRQRDKGNGGARPISTQRALDIIKVIAGRAGYEGHVGCHTMRKTYAWSVYDASGENLSLLQKTLNHSSQAVTMHYIGIDQKDINETIDKMRNMF